MATDPSLQITAKSQGIKELMKSAYFEIPMNQREYRWQVNAHLTKFWDDLLLCIRTDFSNGAEDPLGHFLGAIVVIGSDQSLPSRRWRVIDGQQRLTTITILAECLRYYVPKHSDARFRMRKEHVLVDCVLSPGAGDVDYPRLILNHEPEFYRHSLIACNTPEEREEYWGDSFDSGSEVQINLINAFRFFDRKIRAYIYPRGDESTADEVDGRIQNLVDALTEHFYALLVRATNAQMAYRLFETLNERGLELSKSDLIRNALLEDAEMLGPAALATVHKNWKMLLEGYEGQAVLEIDQLIQFSYTYRFKQGNIEKVDKDRIFDLVSSDLRDSRVSAQDLSKGFAMDAENFSNFLQGVSAERAKSVANSHYAIIDPLWKDHVTPMLLAAVDICEDDDAIAKILQLTEDYLFRQGVVCRDSVLSLQKAFGNAATILRDTSEVDAVQEHLRRLSPDDVYVDAFRTASVKNMKQGFYVLWKIENFILHEQGSGLTLFEPRQQSASQHLEHIMPRKPGDEWEGIQERDGFKNYLSRLGNMLVLESDINSYVKNTALKFKVENEAKRDYRHSDLSLPHVVVKNMNQWAPNGNWDFTSIDSFQNYLAEEYALNVWPL